MGTGGEQCPSLLSTSPGDAEPVSPAGLGREGGQEGRAVRADVQEGAALSQPCSPAFPPPHSSFRDFLSCPD